jgi:UDP-N-acetylmuramoyl-tripeptide--D-alanyl-D-alanine ligase
MKLGFDLGMVGQHLAINALAVMASLRVLGADLARASRALSVVAAAPGRGARSNLAAGGGQILLLDESYNANPASMAAALANLAAVDPDGRRIAVLGDMLELGRYSTAEHKQVGKDVAETADLLLTVGFRARDIAEGALMGGMKESAIRQYEDALSAGKELQELLQPGDVVLIKGSQSMRMERTVEEVMAEPLRARELLVRQDREWRRR